MVWGLGEQVRKVRLQGLLLPPDHQGLHDPGWRLPGEQCKHIYRSTFCLIALMAAADVTKVAYAFEGKLFLQSPIDLAGCL